MASARPPTLTSQETTPKAADLWPGECMETLFGGYVDPLTKQEDPRFKKPKPRPEFVYPFPPQCSSDGCVHSTTLPPNLETYFVCAFCARAAPCAYSMGLAVRPDHYYRIKKTGRKKEKQDEKEWTIAEQKTWDRNTNKDWLLHYANKRPDRIHMLETRRVPADYKCEIPTCWHNKSA